MFLLPENCSAVISSTPTPHCNLTCDVAIQDLVPWEAQGPVVGAQAGCQTGLGPFLAECLWAGDCSHLTTT